MKKCDFCKENRKVIIKFELFNEEVDEVPITKTICLLCLDKKKYKIDIRDIFQFELEDLIDFSDEYFESDE